MSIIISEFNIFLLMFMVQVEKEREYLKGELSKKFASVKAAEVTISNQLTQIENLNHVISDADEEMCNQKRTLDNMKNERDIFGAQVLHQPSHPMSSCFLNDKSVT